MLKASILSHTGTLVAFPKLPCSLPTFFIAMLFLILFVKFAFFLGDFCRWKFFQGRSFLLIQPCVFYDTSARVRTIIHEIPWVYMFFDDFSLLEKRFYTVFGSFFYWFTCCFFQDFTWFRMIEVDTWSTLLSLEVPLRRSENPFNGIQENQGRAILMFFLWENWDILLRRPLKSYKSYVIFTVCWYHFAVICCRSKCFTMFLLVYIHVLQHIIIRFWCIILSWSSQVYGYHSS